MIYDNCLRFALLMVLLERFCFWNLLDMLCGLEFFVKMGFFDIICIGLPASFYKVVSGIPAAIYSHPFR